MANAQEWASIPENQRETIEERHSENEDHVKNTLQTLNKTLEMLGWLNTDDEIRRLFLLDEMVSRLVNMLFYVLQKLVGAKGLELKVSDFVNMAVAMYVAAQQNIAVAVRLFFLYESYLITCCLPSTF